ncbi:MAG: hypothetical protein ACTSQY_00930 [Candidatus Odinarchaeia archaeon]
MPTKRYIKKTEKKGRVWDLETNPLPDYILKNMADPYFNMRCSIDFKFFYDNQVGPFLPIKKGSIYHPLKPFHMEWINLMQKHTNLALEAPRGHAKTSVLGIGYPLWRIKHIGGFKAMGIAYDLKDQAWKNLAELEHVVDHSPYLYSLKPEGKKPKDWNKGHLKFVNGSMYFCRAYTPGAVGVHVDYLFCDEMPKYIDHSIFFNDIFPTAQTNAGHICGIGTPAHELDLLAKLSKNPEFYYKRYTALDEETRTIPLWPERFPLEKLRSIERGMRLEPGAFEKQYMCNRVSSDDSYYPWHIIKDCFDEDARFSDTIIGNCFITCDFALSQEGDYSVFIIWDYYDGILYLRKAYRFRGMHEDEQIRLLKEINEIYRPSLFFIDETNIGQMFKNRLLLNGLPIEGTHFESRRRHSMLVSLRQTFVSKRISIPMSKDDPDCLNFAQRLVKELISAKKQKTQHGLDTIYFRSAHDDCGITTAMGAFKAATLQPSNFFAVTLK